MADKTLATALERFKLVADATSAQRRRELDALRFVDFDEQWPDDVVNMRRGQPGNNQTTIGQRPMLTINKIRPAVKQIQNQQRSAKLAIKFAPKGNGASKETAEVFSDIARAVQVDSRADLARNWAFAAAVKCGRGAYRILTDYANDGDDQLDIIYRRILNQQSVYLDPYATEPDWSDGQWAFVTEDLPFDTFKRKFPESKWAAAASGGDLDLTAIGDQQADWIRTDTEGNTVVRVAEYFYIEHETRQRVQVDGQWAFADEQADGFVIGEGMSTRDVAIPHVKWCKITATEILEEGEWPGRYIPIVPVIGEESYVENQRRFIGIVEPAMDAQRSYNYMRSAEIEAIGLAPRAPFIAEWTQIADFQQYWNNANTTNFAYLPYKAVSQQNGQPIPPPQRNSVEPPIQAIAHAVQEANGDIKATTNVFDPSLGNLSPNERSGRAILALQKQTEMGTSDFIDNLVSGSMVYEGKILKDLIPKVYDTPGRIVAAIGEDEERRSVMLNAPFVQGPDGQPQGVPPETPGAKVYDLSQGEYTITSTVGKAYTTRREEGAASMGELAQAAPQLMPMIADKWVGNLDFPGATAIADRLHKMFLAQYPQLADESGSPEQQAIQAGQKLQQAMQMVEGLTKTVEEQRQIIDTDQVKAMRDLERDKIQAQRDIELAGMKANADAQVDLVTLQQKQQELEVKLEIELAKLGSAMAMKRGELEMQQLHQHDQTALATREADDRQRMMDRAQKTEAE